MIALIDADSLPHKVYHVVNNMELSDSEKIEEGLQILSDMEASMFNEFEDEMGAIDTFVYFFTTCTNNFRKAINEDYKANRTAKDKLFYTLFDEYVMLKASQCLVVADDELEADDLLPKFIRENGLKPTEYCVFNIDKDLDQLEGFHFNYQRVVLRDEKGEIVLTDDGKKIMRYKGLKYISKKEGFYNFCKLMLIGDSSDNIKGVNRVGEKTADKILKNKTIFGMWRTVVSEYLEKESRKKLETNIKLIRLR